MEPEPTAGAIEIVTVIPPRISVTALGDLSESDAATYMGYRMREEITTRRLREWRATGQGPVFHSPPTGRPIWYRLPDLDDWIAIDCAHDPRT